MYDFVDCDFAIRGEAEESLPSLISEIKNSGVKDEKPAGERYKMYRAWCGLKVETFFQTRYLWSIISMTLISLLGNV